MKKLLITLLLISPFSFADWGDVYYCQETTHSTTSLEGKRTDYRLEKFQFKLDKNKNAMVFGKSGFLGELVEKLQRSDSYPSQEYWWTETEYTKSFFFKGKFVLANLGNHGITSISADCDKF